MTNNQKILVELLRMAIAGDGKCNCSLDGVNWMALIEELYNQTVLGLVWGELETNAAIASKLSIDDKLEFYGQARKLAERNKEVNKAVSDIVSTLNAAGINSILLKGQGCASFYSNPLYRSPGDIDLLVGKENFYKAQECLANAGLVGDWIHEDMVHGMLACGDVTLELHKFAAILPDKYDKPFQEAILPCLDERYKECPRIIIDNTEVALLPIELNAAFTFIHMFRHFVGYGVLFRQVCDWLLMMRRITETKDAKTAEETLGKCLKDFGFLNAWKIFAQMAVECMGIPKEKVLLYEKNCSKHTQRLLEVLLKGDILDDFEINKKKPIRSVFNLLMFYKAYLKHFRIFPRECVMLLKAIIKINVEKNLFGKLKK